MRKKINKILKFFNNKNNEKIVDKENKVLGIINHNKNNALQINFIDKKIYFTTFNFKDRHKQTKYSFFHLDDNNFSNMIFSKDEETNKLGVKSLKHKLLLLNEKGSKFFN